jgi:hypothetical protein
MSPAECRAKAAQIRLLAAEQPDFAETAERIAREWERAALQEETATERHDRPEEGCTVPTIST